MGTLYIVATPIGNLDDITVRALRVLSEVSLIAAEDTRHSRRLLTHFAIDTPMISYHEHNQRERREKLLLAIAAGDVALITDAGTPGISDPGADLVRVALQAGHQVSPIPGPSSLAAAVSVSGLIEGPFTMLGFLPRERSERLPMLGHAAASGWPLVIFETAPRLRETLAHVVDAMGDRQAVVARELTKLHEDVRAGTLVELLQWASEVDLRGEIVLVIGAARHEPSDVPDALDVLRTLRRSGLSASKAAREAAAITGLPRSELYQLALGLDTPA